MTCDLRSSERIEDEFIHWFDQLPKRLQTYLGVRGGRIISLTLPHLVELYDSYQILDEIVQASRLTESGVLNEVGAMRSEEIKKSLDFQWEAIHSIFDVPKSFTFEDFKKVAKTGFSQHDTFLKVMSKGQLSFDRGQLQIHFPNVIQMLIEDCIDIRRIKTCLGCFRLYWAKRLDSKTCGEQKCVNDFQNQKKKEKREKKLREQEDRRLSRREFLEKDFSTE